MLTALLVAAGSATAVAWGPPLEPADHHLYRFDQRRPLTLGPQRIAVYQGESLRTEKPRLADLGIGHHYEEFDGGHFSTSHRSGVSIPMLVEALSRRG